MSCRTTEHLGSVIHDIWPVIERPAHLRSLLLQGEGPHQGAAGCDPGQAPDSNTGAAAPLVPGQDGGRRTHRPVPYEGEAAAKG